MILLPGQANSTSSIALQHYVPNVACLRLLLQTYDSADGGQKKTAEIRPAEVLAEFWQQRNRFPLLVSPRLGLACPDLHHLQFKFTKLYQSKFVSFEKFHNNFAVPRQNELNLQLAAGFQESSIMLGFMFSQPRVNNEDMIDIHEIIEPLVTFQSPVSALSDVLQTGALHCKYILPADPITLKCISLIKFISCRISRNSILWPAAGGRPAKWQKPL